MGQNENYIIFFVNYELKPKKMVQANKHLDRKIWHQNNAM